MINTGYAMAIKDKYYIVPAQTQRFTKAIANVFINALFSEHLKTHPAITTDMIYRDMIDNKRYFKVKYEHKPNMETDINGGREDRYYIQGSNFFGHFKPDNVVILQAE